MQGWHSSQMSIRAAYESHAQDWIMTFISTGGKSFRWKDQQWLDVASQLRPHRNCHVCATFGSILWFFSLHSALYTPFSLLGVFIFVKFFQINYLSRLSGQKYCSSSPFYKRELHSCSPHNLISFAQSVLPHAPNGINVINISLFFNRHLEKWWKTYVGFGWFCILIAHIRNRAGPHVVEMSRIHSSFSASNNL